MLENPEYTSKIYNGDRLGLKDKDGWEFSRIDGTTADLPNGYATTVNLPNGIGFSVTFYDSGRIVITEYCYKKYAIARAIGTIFLFYMFCFAVVALSIRWVMKFRHRRNNNESLPSQEEVIDLKLISWRVVVIAFVGLFTGIIDAAAGTLEWNMPINYVGIVVTFALLPSLIVYLSLYERSKKTVLYFIFVLVFTNMIAWVGMYMLMHGKFFDDIVYTSVVEFGVYAIIPLTADYVRRRKGGNGLTRDSEPINNL